MAVTQYIGARYVPVFFEGANGTEWLPNTQYEPLTIVTRNGNSYTSKRPVPAATGAPENNPYYWASTGVYNQQVEEYRQEVLALGEEVDDIDERLQEVEKPVLAQKYIFLGDSYNDPDYGGWGQFIGGYMGLAETDYYNLYQDGASFYGGTLLAGLQNAVNDMTEDERKKIGHVVVLAGINDAHSDVHSNYDLVSTGISNFCTYCKTNLPNATIFIGYVGNSLESSPILHGRGWQDIALSFERYSRCGEYGARFLPNMEYVLHDYTLMSDDGIHPTRAGAQEIAKYAASALTGGGADIKRKKWYADGTEILTMWDIQNNLTQGMRMSLLAPTFNIINACIYQDNATTLIQLRMRIALLFDEAVTISNGQQFQAGIIKCPIWKAKPGGIYPLLGSAKLADNTYMTVRAHMTINDGNVYIRMDQLGDSWGTASISASQILFTPNNWSMPTMMC